MSGGLGAPTALKSALGAARFRLTGHRAPLAVTLFLTHRCDSSCLNCGLPLSAVPELEPAEILALLDHLAAQGTTRVNLTGGEPLLRDDLGAIIRRCVEHRFWTVLETNGHALPARVHEFAGLYRVMVGLHGPQAVHDAVTGPGAFVKAVAGIDAARGAGLRVGTVTVLGKRTVDSLPWLLDFADAHHTEVVVQLPQTAGSLGTRAARREAADSESIRRSLQFLLEAKLAGRAVAMTETTLRYLISWTDYAEASLALPHEDLQCMAGQVSCVVDADGSVHACTPRMGGGVGRDPSTTRNVRNDGFDAAFAGLRDPPCQACTDTACTESSFLYNLNTPAVIEAARTGIRSLIGANP